MTDSDKSSGQLQSADATILEAVEKTVELFDQGQQVIESSIGKASRGEAIPWDEFTLLDVVTVELRKQARRFEHLVEGLEASSWKPWRVAEHVSISAANELRDWCDLQRQHKIINCHEVARCATEARAWFAILRTKILAAADATQTTETNSKTGEPNEPQAIGATEPAIPPKGTDSKVDDLSNSLRLAYLATNYAEAKNGRRLTDPEAWEYLKENGIEGADEFDEYDLPLKETFGDYMNRARRALDEKKYSPKGGRRGGSVVRSSDS